MDIITSVSGEFSESSCLECQGGWEVNSMTSFRGIASTVFLSTVAAGSELELKDKEGRRPEAVPPITNGAP